MVTHIEDSYGNIIATFIPQMHEIFSESTSYKMLDMLKAVVDGGTGGRLRWMYNLKGEMGGKPVPHKINPMVGLCRSLLPLLRGAG